MAPLLYRDCYELEDQRKHSLRTARTVERVEEFFTKTQNFDSTQVKVKENFFRSVGLQMRRLQCDYNMSHNSRDKCRKINIPSGVRLQNCTVVIQGASCSLCGKYFKCKTDVDTHVISRHNSYNESTDNFDRILSNNVQTTKSVRCKLNEEPFEYSTSLQNYPEDQHKHKLRLTFKIGDEVVTQVAVKRKYLKSTIDTACQTEFEDVSGLNVQEDNGIRRDVGIDSQTMDSDLNTSGTSTTRSFNGTNQYFDDNVIQAKRARHTDSTLNENSTADNVTSTDVSRKLYVKSTNVQLPNVSPCRNVPNKPKIVSDETNTFQRYKLQVRNNTKNKCSGRDIHKQSDRKSALIENAKTKSTTCRNTHLDDVRQKTTEIRSILRETLESDKNVIQGNQYRNMGISSRETLWSKELNTNDSNCKSLEEASHGKVLRTKPIQETQSRKEDTNTVRTSCEWTPSSRIGSMDASTRTNETNIENENEIQEILRDNGGDKPKDYTEINHESPNRLEREMLVLDVIRDMIRMEEKGYHLLAQKARLNGKDETNKEYLRFCYDDITDARVTNAVVKVKENTCTIAGNTDQTDISTKNVLLDRLNLDIPLENLLQYGINYYDEGSEINNNEE